MLFTSRVRIFIFFRILISSGALYYFFSLFLKKIAYNMEYNFDAYWQGCFVQFCARDR